MINFLEEHQPQLTASLRIKTKEYTKLLTKNKLRDHLLKAESVNKMNIGNFILEFFMLWFGMPVYAIGLALNFPPYYFAKKFFTKKIKHIEFYASVYFSVAMVLWLFYYAAQLLAVALVFRSWTLLSIYAVLVPATAGHVLGFYPMMKKIMGRWKLLKLVRKEKKIVETLVFLRNEIITEIEQANYFYSSKN